MNLKRFSVQICLILLVCQALPSALSQGGSPQSDTVVVNIMIDATLYPYALELTPEEKEDIEIQSLLRLADQCDNRDVKFTAVVTGDMAPPSVYQLFITHVGKNEMHELALGGMNTDEMVGPMNFSQQYSRLLKARDLVKDAYICGGRVINVEGFKPQMWNQSETTYDILDQLKIKYDAGFISGIIYMPGHETDTWPYPVADHDFYAVPVSVHEVDGDQVYLSDRYAKENLQMSASQWSNLLVDEFEECMDNGDPMVIVLQNYVSGYDRDYLDAFTNFLDYAAAYDATFVTTLELSEMARES